MLDSGAATVPLPWLARRQKCRTVILQFTLAGTLWVTIHFLDLRF